MSFPGPRLERRRLMESATPAFARLLPIIKTEATVITAGCANPVNASLGGTISARTKIKSVNRATRSNRHLPHIKSTNAIATTAKTIS